MNRKRVGAVLALVAAFGLGAAFGGFGVRSLELRGFSKRMHGPPGRARMEFRLEAMARHLDLNAEQQTKIRSILEAHEDERRAAFERCAPEHSKLKDKVDQEIRAVLDPDQQKKHDEMVKRIRDRRASRSK